MLLKQSEPWPSRESCTWSGVSLENPSREGNIGAEQNCTLFGVCCPNMRPNRSAVCSSVLEQPVCSAFCWAAACSDDRRCGCCRRRLGDRARDGGARCAAVGRGGGVAAAAAAAAGRGGGRHGGAPTGAGRAASVSRGGAPVAATGRRAGRPVEPVGAVRAGRGGRRVPHREAVMLLRLLVGNGSLGGGPPRDGRARGAPEVPLPIPTVRSRRAAVSAVGRRKRPARARGGGGHRPRSGSDRLRQSRQRPPTPAALGARRARRAAPLRGVSPPPTGGHPAPSAARRRRGAFHRKRGPRGGAPRRADRHAGSRVAATAAPAGARRGGPIENAAVALVPTGAPSRAPRGRAASSRRACPAGHDLTVPRRAARRAGVVVTPPRGRRRVGHGGGRLQCGLERPVTRAARHQPPAHTLHPRLRRTPSRRAPLLVRGAVFHPSFAGRPAGFPPSFPPAASFFSPPRPP